MSGQKFCRFCGAPLAEDSLFCENCGKAVAAVDVAAEAAETVEEVAADVVEEAEAVTADVVEEAEEAAEDAAEAAADIVADTPAEVTAAAEEAAETAEAFTAEVAEDAAEVVDAVEAAVEAPVAEAVEEVREGAAVAAEEVKDAAAAVAGAEPAPMAFGVGEGFTDAPSAAGFTEAPAAAGFTEAPAPEAPATPGFTEAPAPAAPAADGFQAAPAPEAPAADGFQAAPAPAAPAADGFQTAASTAAEGFTTNVSAAGDTAFNAQPAPVKPPKSKKKFLIPLIIFAVLLAAAGAFYAMGNRTTDVDISDCFDIKISGYEGSATATGDLNWTAVVDKLEEAGCDTVESRAIANSISLSCSPAYDLKNGDTVTCTVSFDEEAAKDAHINITTTSKTLTVADLKDKPVNRMVGTWDAVLIKSRSRNVTMTPAQADLKFEVTFTEDGRVTALTNGKSDGAATWTYDSGNLTLNSNGTIMKGHINGKNQLVLNLNDDIVVTMEKRK